MLCTPTDMRVAARMDDVMNSDADVMHQFAVQQRRKAMVVDNPKGCHCMQGYRCLSCREREARFA